jgi:hypothetical protein
MDRAASLSTLALCGVIAGCNSILGIEASPARPAADASPNRDGSSPPPLSCGWAFASHRKVADLSSKSGPARLFGQTLFASPVPGHSFFRVVASHDTVTGPLELYAIDGVAVGNMPTPQLIGSREQPHQLSRLDASTTGILSESSGDDAGGAQLVLYRIADADRQGSAAAVDQLLDTAILGGASALGATVSVTPTGSVSLVTSFHASSGEHRVALSRPNGGAAAPIVLASDSDEANVRQRGMVEIGDTTHVFIGMPMANLGSRKFAVPRDATVAPAPRTISNMSSFLLAASLNQLGLLNVAFVDLSLQVGLITGQVAPVNVESFQSMDLPIATMFGGLTDVPYTTMPQWIGDNLVTFGHTGVAATDLTIIWADPHGHLRAHQKLDQVPAGSKLGAAAFAPQTQLGDLGGILDVVWVVTSVDPDGGEPYDAMYYDQVQCL